MGTDYPFPMGDPTPVDTVASIPDVTGRAEATHPRWKRRPIARWHQPRMSKSRTRSFNPELESLTCFNCGTPHQVGLLHSVCERCGMPLQVNMRLKPDTEPASVIDPSTHSLWRYSAVLPNSSRSGDLAHRGLDTPRAGRRANLGEGRGPQPDRVVQGPGHVDGSVGGCCPRGPSPGRPIRGERRRGALRLWCGGRSRSAGGHAR